MEFDRQEFSISDLDILKHIGSGSFSNVYLCKKSVEDGDNPFIIKEININKLVKRYMGKSKGVYSVVDFENGRGVQYDPNNITPYSVGHAKAVTRASEYEYYLRKLKGLIESEIDVLKMLDHRNIVKFICAERIRDVYYINMEYCNIGDVHHFAKRDNSTVKLSCFLSDIVGGLEYMHSLNIMHRDIKLQNFLVDYNNGIYTFKISDFGFACYDLYGMEEDDIDVNDPLCRKYYKMCGTPYYMAPEIILNLKGLENITHYERDKKKDTKETPSKFYDKSIDIWSLGISIFEYVVGKLPFGNISDISDLQRYYKSKDAQFRLFNKIQIAEIPEAVKEMLFLALKIDPKERVNIHFLKKFVHDNIDNIKDYKSRDVKNELIIESKYFLKNFTKLDDNIIREPIRDPTNCKDSMRSWLQVEKDIDHNMVEGLKDKVDKGFFNWLYKKM
uniref:Protein kinase domain-containing protein n=1 Tax=viral metagenome TaxID=1070528 RepID=A0A6C0E0K0_9ZZZZ